MKYLCLLVGVSLLAVAWAGHHEHYPSFSDFKEEYHKDYPNENVEKYRKKVYQDNERYVKHHNELYEKGHVTFKMRLNHLADMLPREFSETFLGFNRSLLAHNKVMEGTEFARPHHASIPKEMDWRKRGAVTPVKNQGMCGSCWAFSATGALEAHNYIKTGKLVPLSEQNLIDCSSAYGNNGCQGGLMEQAFQYVKDNHGIDTEESYPYEGEDDDCRFKTRSVGAANAGYVTIQEGNEQALLEAVATQGPVSVGIDASHPSFQFYAEGVYYEPECSSQRMDHGVLIVGYGVEHGHKYWLVKNSWGERWGEKGYIKMARGQHNNCGIATTASFPVVSGSPASQESSSSSSSSEEQPRATPGTKPIASSQIRL